MFRKSRTDRRRGYSLIGHFRRVIVTKGAGQVSLSLGATVVIAALVFARCSSSKITGPGSVSSTPSTPSQPSSPRGPSTDLGQPSGTGPLHVPIATLPLTNPCTGQGVVWDGPNSFTNVSSSVQLGTDGQLHARFHLNSQAQGATDPANNPNMLPTLLYNGSQEQDSQDFILTDQSEKFHVEWNIKIIAKGNDGTIFDDDDFFLHIQMDSPVDVTYATVYAQGYCK